MNFTGHATTLDKVGRIVIPKQIRKNLDIQEGDTLLLFTEDNSITIRKFAPGCIFCGECSDTIVYKGKIVCHSCAAKLSDF